MEKFIYKAKSNEGKSVSGQIEARDGHTAVGLLRKRGMFVISLEKKKQDSGLLKFGNKINYKLVVNFTRQLSTMVTAGLSITDALNILEVQSEKAMAAVVSQLLRDVEGGSTLAAAMSKHPKVFSPVYAALVKVGEAAGVLDTVLKRLARNMEKQQEFRGKIKGAMVYPAIVVGGMVVVGLVMMIFVIPKLTQMYKDFGAELPAATEVLIGASKFIARFWYLFTALLVVFIIWFRKWVKTKNGRLQFDLIMLKVPIIGPLKTQVILTEFTRTLGLLVSAGISILDGLRIVQSALGSAVFELALSRASKSVEKGMPLASSLARDPNFPPIVSQMISVGEETGKLDEVLKKMSKYFEVESEQKVKALTTAIEPLIMILLGVGVGFLVISVILPIYNLTNQF